MKRLPIVVILAVVAISLMLVSCSSSGSTLKFMQVTVATDATLPPFEYVDQKTGEIVGFDIDIIKAIAGNQNLEIKYKNVKWDPLLAGMSQGTYDCAISSISITEDRKKAMLFSTPYFAAGQVVVVCIDNTDITGKDTLKGPVGVQINTNGDNELKNIKNISVTRYTEINLAFQALMSKQINAVVCDNPVAAVYVGKSAGKLKVAGNPFTDEQYAIAVAKGKADLLARINAGLKTIKAEGVIEKAAAAWFK